MTTTDNEGWRLWLIPVVMSMVPVFTVLLSALVAMRTGAVPSCVPFIEGCTSISATGRYVPAAYIFRGLLLPYSALFALYWVLVGLWLRSIEPTRVAYAAWTTWAGVTAGATLIVYVVMLGSEGRVYELMRRYGIYFFFLSTYIAQLLTAIAYRRGLPKSRLIGNLQLTACAFVLAAGLLNVFAARLFSAADVVQNVTEWNAALVMFLNICFVSIGWRATDYRWRVSSFD